MRSVTVFDSGPLEGKSVKPLTINLVLEYIKDYLDLNSIYSTDMNGRELNFFSQFHARTRGKRVTFVIDIPEDKITEDNNGYESVNDGYMLTMANKWLKVIATEIFNVALTNYLITAGQRHEMVERIMKDLKYFIRFATPALNHSHLELLYEMSHSATHFDNDELFVITTKQSKTEYIKNLSNFVYDCINPNKHFIVFIEKTFELPKLRTEPKEH